MPAWKAGRLQHGVMNMATEQGHLKAVSYQSLYGVQESGVGLGFFYVRNRHKVF